jgi:hypothetical protein
MPSPRDEMLDALLDLLVDQAVDELVAREVKPPRQKGERHADEDKQTSESSAPHRRAAHGKTAP